MDLEAMGRRDAEGYTQYEISNVSRQNRESRHNLKYWSDGEWLGFGCGAHSTRDGVRWKNASSTTEYVDRVGRGQPVRTDIHTLTASERLGDALFTGLRLTGGIDLGSIGARYNTDVWARFGEQLQPFIDEGLLERTGERIRLTRRGMLLAHEVMAVFV